jgi:preprotein translocase subunit SecE
MALSIYKPGQGYYTRMLSAVGVGVIVLSGVAWLWEKMTTIDAIPEDQELYFQAGMAVGVIAFFGALVYFILNKPRIADFMIATEAEMKKVNWPSKKEIIGSTWVVICGTAFIAILLFCINIGFAELFRKIGVLEG